MVATRVWAYVTTRLDSSLLRKWFVIFSDVDEFMCLNMVSVRPDWLEDPDELDFVHGHLILNG